jgi:riboflavin synthase
MFSGIVYDTGRIKSIRQGSGVKVLTIAMNKEILHPEKGMSIAVNGSCLTAVSFKGVKEFSADVTEETLCVTNLGSAKPGNEVNIEFPLTADKFLSGHIVQGHVDSTGSVKNLSKQADRVTLTVSFQPETGRYIIEKGSVAVDGISLTAYNVSKNSFDVAVIPETFKNTIVRNYKKGGNVNLEFDVIGKYVEKFLRNK